MISIDSGELSPNLTYKEKEKHMAILDRQVCKLKTKYIASVKVQWRQRLMGEAT